MCMEIKRQKTHSIGINFGILLLKNISLGSRNIDYAINNRMRHMHPLRPKLLGQTLCECSQGEFARREGRGEDGAADGSGGAGEDEGGRVFGFAVGGGDEEGEGGAREEVRPQSVSRKISAGDDE